MNLEDKLHELKSRLQDKALELGDARKPIICDDEVISLLAYYKPTTKEELSNITGVGDTFVEKYGSHFIKVIQEEIDKHTSVTLTDEEVQILKRLENRLVDISKRNNMLYAGKLNNKSIDLYNFGSDNTEFKELIMEQQNKKILLCDVEHPYYKKLLKLQREVSRIQTETGSNELYIGYPFVQGLMGIDKFTIKAPLVLFPCIIERERGGFTLTYDTSRDVLYNNTLILANNKFRGKNIVLPDNLVEELNKENFVSEIMSFYNNNGMYISKYNDGFTKFLENSYDEFPEYSTDQLEIYEYMVLGIYSSFSTSMQRDYETMKSNNKVNTIIKDLIWGLNDSKDDVEGVDSEDVDSSFEEGAITYINELNYSQEKVLAVFDNSSSLVVEGPPGTGKSQMITSLIAQAVKSGKRVLMVSEKKQALDVINSRLGELSNYSIIIDAINNKEEFYNQIRKILSNSLEGSRYSLTEIDFLIKKIDVNINKLKQLQTAMFDDNSFGINVQSIYAKCKNYDFNNPEVLKFYNYLKNNVDKRILEMDYEHLRNLKRKFSDKNNNKSLWEYLNIAKKYSFQKYIKLDITDFEYNNFVNYLRTYSGIYDEINNSNIFKKMVLKNKYKKEFIDALKTISIDNETISLYKDVKDRIKELIEFFNNYEEFKINKLRYLELNDSEVIWFDNLCKILEEKESTLDVVNIDLYNYLLYLQIEKFERNNYMTLNSINSFFDITKEINNAVLQRAKLEKIIIKNKLLESLKKLDKNNSRKEIERRSNQTRKMSISKFISKHKFELFDSINIWMMTPNVVSDILPMQDGLFDIVIFDEASQMFIEKAIPSIYRAKKVLIAGDSKQLRPSCLGVGRTVDDEENEDDAIMESDSLLDLAVYKFPKTILNYHYRAKYEELIAFSNYGFYNAELYVSPNVENPSSPPIERIKIDDGKFINRENKREAIEVVNLLKKILNEKDESKTIGIITFNSSQMELILDTIEEERLKDEKFSTEIEHEFNRIENGENLSLFVKNIENVQGDERDIIIFSTLYGEGEDGKVSVNFGWLNDLAGENRLNVAISRAKEKIYVVTSIEPEELNVENTKNRGPKLFRKYLEYARAVSLSNYELVQEILSSLLDTPKPVYELSDTSSIIDNLSNLLRDKGINSIKNVGVGGYVLDLVLLDENNNYVLAIEPDGKVYEYSKIVRERDFHRKKYLETRGWNVYRLWSYNWFKNNEKELNKIIDVYNKLK